MKKTLEELDAIRKANRPLIAMRKPHRGATVVVSMGECGIESGARDVLKAFVSEVYSRALDDVLVKQSGCIGLCSMEPVAVVTKDGESVTYTNLNAQKAKEIVEKHLIGGTVVEDYAI